jgi:predicted hydrocarbon binding protein
MEAQVKGQTILAVKAYIEKKFGTDALSKIIEVMPADLKQVILKTIISGSWQQEKVFIGLLETAELLYGDKRYGLSRDIGLFSAKANISRFYKIFIHFGDPAFVIPRASRFWSQIHNTGQMIGEKISDKSGIARIKGYAFPTKAFCAYLGGYITAILEMSGASKISIKETKCILSGGDCCEFTAIWE